MPAIARARNAFSISYKDSNPAFSGVNGQIAHVGGRGTKSGQKIDEAGSLRGAAIWIACTVLSDEVASLTQRIVLKGDATREPRKQPALRALWSEEPNIDQTRFGLDSSETLSMALWGV